MKASPRQQQLLLDLQDLDNTVARLKRKHAGLPERAEIAAMQGEADAAREAYMAVQRELDTQNAEIERIESDLGMVRQRMERDNQLMSATSSPKEAQALQQELDTLAHRRQVLEEKEFELLEANEQTQATFETVSAAMKAVDDRRRSLAEALSAAEEAISEQLRSTLQERKGLAAEIQRDLLEHYEAIRARVGVGAARLRGKISEASNMELAPAELSEILALPSEELAHCPQTGAILVRSAE